MKNMFDIGSEYVVYTLHTTGGTLQTLWKFRRISKKSGGNKVSLFLHSFVLCPEFGFLNIVDKEKRDTQAAVLCLSRASAIATMY